MNDLGQSFYSAFLQFVGWGFTIEGLVELIGAWLSLVERCVRDAEVVSSNLAAPIFLLINETGRML